MMAKKKHNKIIIFMSKASKVTLLENPSLHCERCELLNFVFNGKMQFEFSRQNQPEFGAKVPIFRKLALQTERIQMRHHS